MPGSLCRHVKSMPEGLLESMRVDKGKASEITAKFGTQSPHSQTPKTSSSSFGAPSGE